MRLACIPSFLSIALHLFKCLQGREEQVREREREREGERMRVEEDLVIITGGVLMFDERLYGK